MGGVVGRFDACSSQYLCGGALVSVLDVVLEECVAEGVVGGAIDGGGQVG